MSFYMCVSTGLAASRSIYLILELLPVVLHRDTTAWQYLFPSFPWYQTYLILQCRPKWCLIVLICILNVWSSLSRALKGIICLSFSVKNLNLSSIFKIKLLAFFLLICRSSLFINSIYDVANTFNLSSVGVCFVFLPGGNVWFVSVWVSLLYFYHSFCGSCRVVFFFNYLIDDLEHILILGMPAFS